MLTSAPAPVSAALSVVGLSWVLGACSSAPAAEPASPPTHVVEAPPSMGSSRIGAQARATEAQFDETLRAIMRSTLPEVRDLYAELDAYMGELEPPLDLVTNEVGLGIVPENALARAFRDAAGEVNQTIAEAADEVYLAVSGYPLKVKPNASAQADVPFANR